MTAMEPSIQYARTSDGVSIPYYTIGEGPPLVYMPPPMTFIEREWGIPGYLPWLERFASRWTVVRYDNRTSPSADKGLMDSLTLDLEAVIDHLGLDRLVLYSSMFSGPAAIAFTVEHPERVSHLVLSHSLVRGGVMAESPQFRGLMALAENDWETATETLSNVAFGWSAGEPARKGAAVIREKMTPDTFTSLIRGIAELDATDVLRLVKVPTLVLQRRNTALLPVEVARELAAGIPGARLVLLEGESIAPYIGDPDAMYHAVSEFLGQSPASSVPPEPSVMRTILFTDVEGSTALTDRLGDERARELLREHERITREALAAHGGSEVKTMGDGFMAWFGSATKALECAIAVQQGMTTSDVRIRIGLNAGEPIEEDEDLFGTAVNMAARIAAKADGGEILVSDVVRQLVAGKKFLFNDRGETELRGFEDPVRLFEVRWQA
jgi:class 3 adenylate cyclase